MVCVCTCVSAHMNAHAHVCEWLKLTCRPLFVFYCHRILSHYCCECKYYLLRDTRLIVAWGWKKWWIQVEWMDAVDWLQLVCWTWVWDLLCSALCLAFPLASFLFTFPCSFFLLVVKIVHQCGLKLSQWSDPCLNVLGASCWIAQANCCWYEDVGWCLYWAGGLYTWRHICIAGHWMVDLAEVMTLGFVCQFGVLVSSGLTSKHVKHIKCTFTEGWPCIQKYSYTMN